MRLKDFLLFGLFSLTLLTVVSSCDLEEEHRESWSFNNRLDESVDLSLYYEDGTFVDYLSIAAGDSVVLLSSKGTNVGGVGPGHLFLTIDSVIVSRSLDDVSLALWRNQADSDFAKGYELLPEFFDDLEWCSEERLIQLGKNRVLYRFLLTLP